jgi:catechol 2,3-dioxygenase-like lactoylglutathione lyase family enzyme
MDVLINKMLNEFESGKLSRRKLIETLAVTAMTIYGTTKVSGSELVAAPVDRAHLDSLMVNHISYRINGPSADYRKARDFYADLMGMHVVNDTPDPSNPQFGQCNLAFYAKGETPIGQPAGTPSPFLLARCSNPNAPPRAAAAAPAAARGGAAPAQAQPQSQVHIDHIAYTIADWDPKRVESILKARGLNPTLDQQSFHVYDPQGYDLQIAGIEMSAFN